MIDKAINRAFDKARFKKWDKIYWLVDIHETMIKPNYNSEEIPTEFYPHTKEVLQFLSNRPDIVLIIYTCSWPQEIEKYKKLFKENGIEFLYSNENPEVETVPNKYGYYLDKPYADVVLDDKAGFDWETDWLVVKDTVEKQPSLCEQPHVKNKMFDMEKAAEWLLDNKNNN